MIKAAFTAVAKSPNTLSIQPHDRDLTDISPECIALHSNMTLGKDTQFAGGDGPEGRTADSHVAIAFGSCEQRLTDA